MILFCAGMIRSGSTLQYNIAKEVVEETGSGSYFHGNMQLDQEIFKHGRDDEWWVTKGHVYTPHVLDSLVKSGYVRVVMTYRDLRDVFLSTMYFRRRRFDQILSRFRNDTVRHDRQWLTRVPSVYIHRVRYEDMINDTVQEALAIADLIGVNLPLEKAQEISDRHTLREVKGFTSKLFNWDAHTRYAPEHIRTGGSGDWKEELSAEQVEKIEAEVGDWLEENGYGLSKEFSGG